MKSKTSITIFKIVAWYAGLYHIILGLLGTFANSNIVISVASKVYGISVVSSSQFLYLAKFISAYMIAFGIMLLFLGINPQKYKALIIPAIILFVVRIFDRLVFFDLLQDAFGSTMQQNIITISIAAIIAILLFVFRPKSEA